MIIIFKCFDYSSIYSYLIKGEIIFVLLKYYYLLFKHRLKVKKILMKNKPKNFSKFNNYKTININQK